MIVLGINDGHDAGACLLREGKLLLYSAEERRRNIKNYPGVPTESIAALFSRTGIAPKDVNLVALSSKIRTTVPTRGHKPVYTVLNALSFLARSEWATNAGRWLLSRARKRKELLTTLAEHGMADTPMLACDHHETHAATAYYHRPWDGPATILTMDGAGDGLSATVSHGTGFEMKRLSATPKYHSVAAGLYSAITAYLGLKPYEHEYKVMGMAPYGQAEHCIDLIRPSFTLDGLTFRNHTGRTGTGTAIRHYFHKVLEGQRFDNVSAACQQVFEELVVQWAKNAVQATGVNRIVAAGGAFLNVKANKLIRESAEVESFYAYPCSDDGGTPVGAAILGYLHLCQQKGVTPSLSLPKDMYLGFDHTEQEMEAAAKASGFHYRRMTDPANEIAGMLVDGQIVARFDGREEAGPRALGNRSILADPRDLRYIRKLNFAIKQRDFWMPFAASILQEDATRYLKNPTGWAYYMIEAFDSTPEGGEVLVGGSHPFDRTIRPQLVNELNPGYRDIIRAFKARTGVGGVLNTSFNLHGSPVVGSPEIALDTLKKSELDAVALGPFLVTKGDARGSHRTQ
jgi:carbamoyltransferase